MAKKFVNPSVIRSLVNKIDKLSSAHKVRWRKIQSLAKKVSGDRIPSYMAIPSVRSAAKNFNAPKAMFTMLDQEERDLKKYGAALNQLEKKGFTYRRAKTWLLSHP